MAFITTFYRKEELKDIKRLKEEISDLGFSDYKIYVHDNSRENLGYAHGINEGIKKALKDGADLFVVMNPDISFLKAKKDDLLAAGKHFDILGFAHKQNGKTYYGGEIDKWRMSGGLITKKPKERFSNSDFVSGSLMFIKHTVIERLGLLDESYFFYYEEVDYCFRARKSGFRVGIDRDVFYRHFERSDEINPKKDFYLARSRLKFFLRFSTWQQKLREILRAPKTVFEEFPLIYRYILEKKFLVNFFSLNVSSFFNKFIHFILFLFLVRLISPSGYGIYTLVWAHVGLLSPLLDWGTTSYGLVYSAKYADKNLFSLFSLRVFLALAVFILTIVLAIIFHYPRQTFILIVLTSFVILSVMFSGSYLILASLKQKLYIASAASMLFNLVLIIASIIALIAYKTLFSVFVTVFIFYSLYGLVNIYLIFAELKTLSFVFNLKEWFAILKKSTIFLLIGVFAGFYFKLDVFLLNFLKGTKEVGIYSSGYKFLDAMMLVVASYNIASLPIFSRLHSEKDKLVKRIRRDIFFVVIIGIICTIGIYIFANPFLGILLPKSYAQSIPVVKIVIFALPFILVTSVFLNTIYVLDKAYLAIFLFIFQIVFNFVLNIIFIPKFSYFASSYITVGGEILNTTITFLLLQRYLKII